MSVSTPSYYDVLQVSRTAPQSEIRSAYRRLAQRYHPDRSPDNAHAPKVMAHLNKAYEVLSDPVQRIEHDRWLRHREAPRQATVSVSRSPVRERIARWPWVLLFATITCGVLSMATVLYKTLPQSPGHPSRSAPSAEGLSLRVSHTLQIPATTSP